MLPTLTKYLAGDTALLGLLGDMHRAATLDTGLVNESAGWLIRALDLPGARSWFRRASASPAYGNQPCLGNS
jgi:hypothetical protein